MIAEEVDTGNKILFREPLSCHKSNKITKDILYNKMHVKITWNDKERYLN
jgi:hypothetical protein